MALKTCRECGKAVSDEAGFCPHCGINSPAGGTSTQRPDLPAKAKMGVAKKFLIGFIFLVIVIGVMSVIGNQQTPAPGPAAVSSGQDAAATTPASISVSDFISSFAGGRALNIPSEETANYQELCREQWTNAGELNQDEFAYCVNQEQQGYSNLISLSHNYSDMPNAQALLDDTLNKWTKSGYRDDNEVQYVFGEQISDFKDFRWLASSPDFNENEGQQCLDQWTSGNPQFQNWSEVDFCYKQSPDFKTPPASQ